MKKGTRKVMIWTGFDLDIIATDVCYILGFYRDDIKLSPDPVETANGYTIRPGDVVTQLGGKKTSAGFSSIWFDEDKGLLYMGKFKGLDGQYLCFKQVRNYNEIVHPTYKGYKTMYYAFIELGFGGKEWLFTNHACAGRLVETTNVVVRKERHNE